MEISSSSQHLQPRLQLMDPRLLSVVCLGRPRPQTWDVLLAQDHITVVGLGRGCILQSHLQRGHSAAVAGALRTRTIIEAGKSSGETGRKAQSNNWTKQRGLCGGVTGSSGAIPAHRSAHGKCKCAAAPQDSLVGLRTDTSHNAPGAHCTKPACICTRYNTVHTFLRGLLSGAAEIRKYMAQDY